MKRALSILLLFVAGLASGQTVSIISTNAAQTLPSSAKQRLFMGNAPDDNVVQTLNPPLFKWLYYHDQWQMGYPNQTPETFRFQLSTNVSGSPLYYDITTSNNFYNCLWPITNSDGSTYGGSNYWWVVYMASNASTVISTGVTHTFTMSSSAKFWDRSQYGIDSYLISVGTNHPHIFFAATNRSAMATFLHTNSAMGFSWSQFTNTVYQTITNSWWNSDSSTNQQPYNLIGPAMDVCLAYQMDSNATLKAANPGQMISRLASSFIANGYDRIDSYTLNETPRSIALGYDWSFDDMNATQRSNTLWCLERFALFYVHEDWWDVGSGPYTNRDYAFPWVNQWFSAAKTGSSHARHDWGAGIFMTWAGMGESPTLRGLNDYFINYAMGQADPFNGDEGRGYAEQSFRSLHSFSAQLMLSCFDPRMTNNPWYVKYPKMFAYWEPLNYVELQGQFGDFGMQFLNGEPATQLYNYKYYDLALMYGNGYLLQQQIRNYTIRSGTSDFFPEYGEAFIPYYFPATPATNDWPDTYYFDESDGWCMSYTYPPNNWNCFTNGVGFILTARPAGNRQEHGTWHDGAPQIFAYGAQVTCGGIGQYFKHPIFYPGLFVDGIGDCTPSGQNPTADVYSRFTAFTNCADFTFAQADLSQAFNNWNTNDFAGGGNGNLETAYNQDTNRRPYVVSVTRSILFPHKKYLVIYDTFQTTTNATFAWKWNVMETNNLSVNTNGCTFSYTSTNFFNGSNVTTYVQHVVDPATMTLFNGVGTNYAVSNIFTKEDFTSSATASTEPKWNSTIYVYNTTKATNWHFMSVVYPTKWGQAAPTITRIDDNTARIQQGSDDDTVTFDNYAGTVTGGLYSITLTGDSGSPVSTIRYAPFLR